MRPYHWITLDATRLGWSDGMTSSTRRDTVRQIKLLLYHQRETTKSINKHCVTIWTVYNDLTGSIFDAIAAFRIINFVCLILPILIAGVDLLCCDL